MWPFAVFGAKIMRPRRDSPNPYPRGSSSRERPQMADERFDFSSSTRPPPFRPSPLYGPRQASRYAPDRPADTPAGQRHPPTGSASALPTERCRERRSHPLGGRPPASTMRHRGVGYAQGRARSGERPGAQPSCPDEGARMSRPLPLQTVPLGFPSLLVRLRPGAFQSHISLYNPQSRGRDDAQCPASGPEHIHPLESTVNGFSSARSRHRIAQHAGHPYQPVQYIT